MARRRKHKTFDELMVVGAIAGVLYLLLNHVAGTAVTTAGYVAVGFGGVLVGLSLRPWADRLLRRFGIRVSYVGSTARRTPTRPTARAKANDTAATTPKSKQGRP